VIVACCLLQRVAHIEYCRVHSHGSLPIVAINESGGGCLPLLAARTRRRCRTPFDSIPRLPLSRLQRARLPMRSHAHALLASALNSLIRIAATLIRIASTLIRIAATLIRIAATAIRIIGACVRHKAQHTTRRIHVAAAQAVPVQMWQRRARSRCRCGGPSPGADVAGVEWAALRRAPARAATDQNNTPQRCAEPSRGFCRAIGAPSTVLCLGAGGRAGWSPRVAPSQLAKTALLPRATWDGYVG
jgi:hypothetical protein